MTKMTNGLATVALAAGLALGTAGAASAAAGTDTGMTAIPTGVGTTELNTPFTHMTTGELSELQGQEVYDDDGGGIGTIQRLVRDVNNHQLYFVLAPRGFAGEGQDNDLGVIPIKKLRWMDKDIVLNDDFPQIPVTSAKPFPYEGLSKADGSWAPQTS